MARLTERPRVDLNVQFNVNEEEARALDALVGYGDDAFIKHFKETLGTAYIRDHEEGLRSFFKAVRAMMPPILHKLDAARRVFEGETKEKS